jgi:small subunit ribosomal protein S21|tara:strand:+ start:307 stop:519 length:213 start_codon:yes stop_codon:yes gene_type:complete
MEVKLKNKDGRKIPLDRALKILKRKIDKEGVLKEVRKRRFFEKKSSKQYKKNKKAKYVAKIIAKENELWR